MDLIRGLREWAFARPRVLVVDAPDVQQLRWSLEEELDRRGWRAALSPADSDLLLVLGTPGEALARAVDVIWSQIPEPRHRVRLEAGAPLVATLDEAASALRVAASRGRLRDSSRPDPQDLLQRTRDHGGMDHGGMDHGGSDGGGMDHAAMGHGGMDHGGMGHGGSDGGGMDHAAMGHAGMSHGDSEDGGSDDGGIDHAAMDHSGMDHSGMDHSGMDHSGMDHSGMDHGGMDHGDSDDGGMDHGGSDDRGMDHAATGHVGMDHGDDSDDGAMDQVGMDHAAMGHAGMSHGDSEDGGSDDGEIDHAAMDHSGMDHGGSDDGGMDHGGSEHGGMDHAAMGHGGHGGMDHSGHGGMDVAGLPMAETATDRDGLQLDELKVSLGPVLPGWPTGLLLRGRLQGDVLTGVGLSWLDQEGASADALDAGDSRPAALDRLARFLDVAGWPLAAHEARQARAGLMSHDPDVVAQADRLAVRVARRVRRSRTLAWSARGTGVMTTEGSGPLEGDVLDRVRRWCDTAAGEQHAPEPLPELRLDTVATLLEGAEIGAARLTLASLPLSRQTALEHSEAAGV
ncbi:hypothetical protein [Blastococcus sp. LR1]|uniref:hypothetical protein n=1 Tax=Blastococcus sp. LR1 TaxID=2877000 RepID=UPI001CCDE408|nr:hypothetical protein [Blastococcus sp. LR1]MCA0143807.1 hypothetical protein [Blastococcus sp. LR1]